jgi:hypothetical protein
MTPAKPQPRYLPTLTEVVQPQERVYGQSEPNKPPPVGIDPAKQGGTDLTQIEAELRAALQVVAQDQVREFSATVDHTLERLVQDALVRLGKSKSN